MKYLVLCKRHESTFGNNWCLWWGYGKSRGGYTSDLRLAHRFAEEEIKEFEGHEEEDLPIKCEDIGVSEEQIDSEKINKNALLLMEKGKLCKIIGIKWWEI